MVWNKQGLSWLSWSWHGIREERAVSDGETSVVVGVSSRVYKEASVPSPPPLESTQLLIRHSIKDIHYHNKLPATHPSQNGPLTPSSHRQRPHQGRRQPCRRCPPLPVCLQPCRGHPHKQRPPQPRLRLLKVLEAQGRSLFGRRRRAPRCSQGHRQREQVGHCRRGRHHPAPRLQGLRRPPVRPH